MKQIFAVLLICVLAFGAAGCTNMTRTQQGVLSGGAGGALVGAGINVITGGSATIGALVGGGLGALAGGIYGHQQERVAGSPMPSFRPRFLKGKC